MPSLTVAGPYPDAAAGVTDGVLFQTYYRQLGMVSVNVGVADVYAAAEWLAAHGRGGTVTRIRPRLVEWDGLTVAPGVPGAPTMDVWILGWGGNTAIVRKGWWSLYLFPAVTQARLAVTTRIVAAIPKPGS